MRVAIDARALYDGGIGTYIRGLASALAVPPGKDEWTALVPPAHRGATRWGGDVHEVAVRARRDSLAEHWAIPRAARSVHAELLHSPQASLPMGWSGASLVTVHDVTRVRLAHLLPFGVGALARLTMGAAVRRASVVATGSEAGKRDIVEYLGAPAGKVRVVPLGVSPLLKPVPAVDIAVFRSDRQLPAQYVLYVGARKRHKNLELLVRAWGAMRPTDRPPLVLSGLPWDDREPLAQLARMLGVERSVRFSGELHDEVSLACLYSGAALVVQPSLAEGFGLPTLEALACGVAVLSSDAGSLPEVLGDCAVYLPPRDAEAWANEVLELLNDGALRTTLGTRGRARAATYTWARTAQLTRALYDEALGRKAH